jgi:hypothetical protein
MPPAPKAQPKNFRQKVDHKTELMSSNPALRRDIELYQTLQKIVRGNLLKPSRRAKLKIAPRLYSKYRGDGFPLRTNNNTRVPRWRDVTPWLKAQVGLMALAEGTFIHFKVSLHDQLLDELVANGTDLQVYLRDRIARCLRAKVGCIPFYFFVFEDRDNTGQFEVPPHAHGSMLIMPCKLPKNKSGQTLVRYRRMELQIGKEAAELEYGRELVFEGLREAAGLSSRPKHWKGKSQSRRVWRGKPANQFFNENWGTYAFKNTRFVSKTLDDNRLVFSGNFKTETSNLWQLITKGEIALSYWLNRGHTVKPF